MKPLTPDYEKLTLDYLKHWNDKVKKAGRDYWTISTEFVDYLLDEILNANTAEDEPIKKCTTCNYYRVKAKPFRPNLSYCNQFEVYHEDTYMSPFMVCQFWLQQEDE